MKKEKILVLAPAGAGKTYMTQHYKNVVDFEYLFHLWDYDEDVKGWPYDNLKGIPNRKPNPEWPWNYIEDVKNELESGNIIVIPGLPNSFHAFCIIGREYLGRDVRIILAAHHENNYEMLAEVFRKRGNPESFVELVRPLYKQTNELYRNCKTAEYIEIPKGKFLADVLIEHGVKLEFGVGIIKENREGGRHLKDKYMKKLKERQEYIIDIRSSTINKI